jgi:hypothetical protein
VPAIKAKIDTGARTSAIHAFRLDTFDRDGLAYARFAIHPLQRNTDLEIECIAPVIDRRVVRDSGGHAEERLVIETELGVGPVRVKVEATLTSREDMLFRMLIGRTALKATRMLVDSSRSFVFGRASADSYNRYRPPGAPV